MKKKILALALVVVLAVGMFFAYTTFSEKTTEGAKTITIEVVNSQKEATLYETKTDAEYLLGALEDTQELEIGGSEGQYGFTVTSVNGEVADFTVDSSYWAFYLNGEYCNYGVSEQPVADGDAFRIVYEAY